MNKITKWVLVIACTVVVTTFALVWHRDANTQVKLNGEKNILLDYGEQYKDEGITISYRDQVLDHLYAIQSDFNVNKVGTYTFNYEYKWLYKKHNLIRKIEVVDTKTPVLKLKGNKDLTLQINEAYQEPGFEADDNYDGDLSDMVEVNGTVNHHKPGLYELIYRVKDSSENASEAIRKVKVIKPKPLPTTPAQPESKLGVIYLTFDDGPHATKTDAILDILKSEGVQATFFVTGRGPDAPIKRIVQEGHTIALHTYTHVYSEVYASVDNYYQDLKMIGNRVENLTGIQSKLIRFPGGSSNTISRNYNLGIMSHLVHDIKQKSYIYHDWNVDSQDAVRDTSAQSVYQNTVKGLSKNRPNIVLMHDVHQHTIDALRDVIHYGKNNGYIFEKITESTKPVHHNINN